MIKTFTAEEFFSYIRSFEKMYVWCGSDGNSAEWEQKWNFCKMSYPVFSNGRLNDIIAINQRHSA